MTRIAFFLNFPLEYKGGVNYFKNLFIAINKVNNGNLVVLLFVPDDLPQDYIAIFGPYVQIVRTKVIRRKSLTWWIDKIGEKAINYNPVTEWLLKKHKINIVSHSNYISGNKNIGSINWIPDFQYVHYPDLWTSKQLAATKKLHNKLADKTDIIVLSSNDALKDFQSVYPQTVSKVKVIHFVSQPAKKLPEIDLQEVKNAVKKYAGDDVPYFYLPNQFWVHKNHIVVFKACRILKEEGLKFNLLTSGFMVDYRSKNGHIDALREFVTSNHLDEHIKFLGLIPYADVFNLIIGAEALINPSYFEGWSSTVEEAKTVGTMTLLSDIQVHREQSPAKVAYFHPDSAEELAELMKKCLLQSKPKTELPVELLDEQLSVKTIKFGDDFLKVVNGLIRK